MAEFIETTLMDGFADGPHVTEVQIGLANQAVIGPDDYVLEGGRESEAQVLTNNSIRIFDGVYCIQGRRDVIPANGYTDVTIANGSQSMNRNDIIVRRYKKDESSEIETTEYAVIKGTPSSGTAVDPEVTIGDIRSGATLHEMALYRVKLTGLNITAVEPMFNILKNMATLQKEFTELNSKSPKVFKSSDSDFISFIAPFDCIAIVSFSCAGWGMNGEFLEFKIKNDQSILQEMFVHTGACSGNNNVYIPLNAKSGFSGLKKGSSYSFSRQNLYSSFGMSWNRQWSAVCLPI